MKRKLFLRIAIPALLFAVGVGGLFLLFGKEPSKADNGETVPQETVAEPLFVPLTDSVDARNAFMSQYSSAKEKFHLRALYEEYLPKVGANGLIDSMLTVTPLCHDEGHDLGKVIFAELKDVGSSLETCHDACSSGCMHGVLMEFFSTGDNDGEANDDMHASLATVTSQMNGFCAGQAVSDQYLPGDCAHGVGHTLMYLADYDIFSTITACDQFDTYAMRYYCATGAYMEYNNNRFDADFATQSTLYPCDISPYPAACFRYKLVNVFLHNYTNKQPFSTILNMCSAIEDKNVRLGCFHGIGNAHIGIIANAKIPIGSVCSAGSDDEISACIDGVMERLGKYFPSIVEPVCETLTVDWQKSLCLAAGARKMYDLTKSFELYQR